VRRIRREAASVKDAAICSSQLLEIAKTYEKLAESLEKQRLVTPRHANFPER
jgi:hypothetical protein